MIAAIAGVLLFYPVFKQKGGMPGNDRSKADEVDKARYLKTTLVLVAVIASFFLLVSLQPVLLKMGLVFFRTGALVFGNGYTMLPLIQQEVVTHYHWLTMNDFAVGLPIPSWSARSVKTTGSTRKVTHWGGKLYVVQSG